MSFVIHKRLATRLALIAATLSMAATALVTATSTHAATGAVATSRSACPSTTVKVPNKNDFRSNASNTTFDATGDAWNQSAGVDDYSVQLNKGGGSGNCFIGGKIQGTNSITTKSFSDLKKCCNGAAWQPYTSASFFNVRADNIAVDDFRIMNKGPSSNYDGNNSYYISGGYLTDTRDDCFSTAHAGSTVHDTLAECYTAVSWRNTGASDKPFPVTLTNNLIYLKPQLSGYNSRCPSQMNGEYGSGQFWKMDNFRGSPSLINVSNTIFRADLGQDNACNFDWADGTYTNDTMVWTGKGAFPGKLPPGVKLTTDKSVWDNAVAKWKCDHGYTCSTTSPSPAPSPSSTSPAPSPSTSPSSSPTSTATHPITKVLTIWLENHSQSQVMNGMPYLASMSKTYGYTTNYKALFHPSLPNYLAFVAGSNLGVTDDLPPSGHKLTGATLFTQALGAGKTAKTYAENMMDSSGTPRNCETADITNPPGYEVHHNPWTYFTDD